MKLNLTRQSLAIQPLYMCGIIFGALVPVWLRHHMDLPFDLGNFLFTLGFLIVLYILFNVLGWTTPGKWIGPSKREDEDKRFNDSLIRYMDGYLERCRQRDADADAAREVIKEALKASQTTTLKEEIGRTFALQRIASLDGFFYPRAFTAQTPEERKAYLEGTLNKINEEIFELIQPDADIMDESGDVLFTVLDLFHHLNVRDFHLILKKVNDKFESRYAFVAELLKKEPNATPEEMYDAWKEAKRVEKEKTNV